MRDEGRESSSSVVLIFLIESGFFSGLDFHFGGFGFLVLGFFLSIKFLTLD